MKYKWWWLCLIAIPTITIADGVCYGFVGVTFLMNSFEAVLVRICLSAVCTLFAGIAIINNSHIRK